LATAHAKSRLANKVEAKDAEVAIELVRYACFKKVLEKEGKRGGNKRKEISSDESDNNSEVDDVEDEMDVDTQQTETLTAGETQTTTLTNNKPRKKQRTKTKQADDTDMQSQDVDSQLPSTGQSIGSSSSSTVVITADRLKVFKSLLFKLFHRERTQALQISQVNDYVKAEFSSVDEIKAALNMMQDDNQIMMSDDTVFII
jgi:DNA replication licensing factor MCM3